MNDPIDPIQTILACVDFSDYSPLVLEYAAALSMGRKRVLVLNVIHQRDIAGAEKVFSYYPGSFSTIINTDDYVDDLKKEREKNLKSMIRQYCFDEKALMEIRVAAGIPFSCILDTVETEGVDLVVMANKGRSNLSRVLFGSAAEKVFHHCPAPVLSVRRRENGKGAK
jgi:nucleotide-binding universal stress UspA family protein